MVLLFSVCIAEASLSPGADFSELENVRMPNRLGDLVLNGMGIREATFLKVDVYVAGLYVTAKTTDPKAILDSAGPKRLEMRFVRDVSREDIQKAWLKSLKDNCDTHCDAVIAQAQALNPKIPDLKKGETMTYFFETGRVRISVNGQEIGTVEGAAFARVLLSCWIGDHPPNTGLKNGLLGLSR